MKERELARRLTAEEIPQPPAELLQRIQDEIPGDLSAAETTPEGAGEQMATKAHPPQYWLAAASIVVAVAGAWLGVRVLERAPAPEETRALPTPSQRSAVGDVALEAGAEPEPGKKEPTAVSAELQIADEPGEDKDRPLSARESATVAAKKAEEPAAPVWVGGESTMALRGGSGQTDSEMPRPLDQSRQETVLEKRIGERLRQLPRGLSEEQRRQAVSSAPPLEDSVTVTGTIIEPQPTTPMASAFSVAGGRETAASLPPPSTGGTHEPNDQPYGDVFYRAYGSNPFIDTEDDRLSTFGLDVDTGSYSVVRRYLRDGHLPPPEAVRVEELLNYFDYGDEPPAEGDFAIHTEAAPSPFGEGPRYYLVRFNLQGRMVESAHRRPATLVFVVDVSGSMNRENRLGLVKQALYLLLDQLREDDRVGLVVYGSRGQVLLPPSEDTQEIRRAIEKLEAGGSTNAEEGLKLGYRLAAENFREGAINRVILCSDGVANVGRTGPESILSQIESEADRGIELTTLGFGMGNYNDVLMEQLADRGDGSYAYIDQLPEARRLLVENLTGTLQTIAGDAKVQVEFHPEAVSRYRLLGYENRDIADERFRDDSVDAGEIGAGHSVTALYEIKLRADAKGTARVATLHLRYRTPASGEVAEIRTTLSREHFAASWEAASPKLRLASLVAELGEILKGSYWAREGDLQEVFRRAQSLSPEFPGDTEVADFVSLVGAAARLKAEEQR